MSEPLAGKKEQIEAFWLEYQRACQVQVPGFSATAFGHTRALADEVAALIRSGDKRAHATLERDFVLKAIPAPTAGAVTATPASAPGGMKWEWVQAIPRQKDGGFQSVEVGFVQGRLAALDILDGFGQRTRLNFSKFDTGVRLPADQFKFTPPAGVDVLNQP